jgi:CubicO group peptidase (beta-lactamase class C family)
MIDNAPARMLLRWARDERVFPGAVVEIGTSADVLGCEVVGSLSYADTSPMVSRDTVYDLASLTKVVATTTVAMRAVAQGHLDLERSVTHYLPEWHGRERAGVSVRDLLEHASGLPAWVPLHQDCRGREAFVDRICRTPLAYEPRSRSEYSDLGFILAGVLLERLTGVTLDTATSDVLGTSMPDAAPELRFRPPAAWLTRTAPTREADERGLISPGDVDDTNAWAMGGVAGHAGMFGTASGLGHFARAILRCLGGGRPCRASVIGPDIVRLFVEPSSVAGSSRALGWDTMRPTSSCGTGMSPAAIGHTGFTGTSLWIDPLADLYVVFLSNRVHPRAGSSDAIQHVRRALHDAVMSSVSH